MKSKMELTAPKRFWDKISLSANCWEWTGGKDKKGYGRFALLKRKSILPHRYSWVLHYGEIPKSMLICHKCDNPSCVNPQHLFMGTNSDNMQDALKKGRFATGVRSGAYTHPEIIKRGEQHYRCKLSDKEVITILKLRKKVRALELAKRYGVTRDYIYDLWSKSYKRRTCRDQILERLGK